MESEKINEIKTTQKRRIGLIIGIISAFFVFLLILLFPKKQQIQENNKNDNEINDLRNELKKDFELIKNDNIKKDREILSLKKELSNGKKSNGSSKSNKKPLEGNDGEEGTGTTEEGRDESTEDD